MTYNKFFDWLFYSYWVGFGVLLGYLIVIYLIRTWFFPNTKKAWKTVVLYAVIPFLWIMTMGEVNPFALGYGKPTAISALIYKDGKLFVRDYIMSSGSKSSAGSPSYRIHIIEPKTGKKLLRFILGGTGTLMGIRGDSLVFGYNNAVVFFSQTTGKEQQEWTKETLPKIFPQFSSGVHDLSVDEDNREMNIISEDGNNWRLDILTRIIEPSSREKKEKKQEPANKINFTKHGIYIENKKSELRLVALCDNAGNDHQQILCGHNDVMLNPNEVFLDAKIVALCARDSCFIIMHYETITRLKVIYTCMSLDGQRKLWELKQSTLRPKENNDESIKSSCCIDEDDSIFFASFEDELVAIQLKNGAILWRQIP